MRIGIITQELANNYGGILQNYALQEVLKRLGHTPLTIDYRPGDSFFWYVVYQIKILVQKMKGVKINFTTYSSSKTNRSSYTTDFINRYIKTTHRVQFLTPVLSYLYRFDYVIVGSDQVWRKEYNVLRHTFLTFVKGKTKKVAYAASFGVGKWEYSSYQTALCKEWIKSFAGVSTREKSGVFLCKEYLDTKAELVLDPTLMLSSSDYSQLCAEIQEDKSEPYLFAYILDLDDNKMEFVDNIAKSKGIRVKVLSAEKDISCSVEKWLSSFRDAEYVITDSFHGTVFSIIFNKPFSVFINENRGADRFNSLLGLLDLKERVIGESHDFNHTIAWEKVNLIIKNKQETSKNFLLDTLK